MAKYKIKNLKHYFEEYQESIENPKKFWNKIAKENFIWFKKWKKINEFDFQKAEFTWFKDAKLNITVNCIDRHLKKKSSKTAIIFEPNNPDEQAQSIAYKELYLRVNKMANVLLKHGVLKGDRVAIYLPMIPELVISVLACARIGAVHSVIFGGFSAKALQTRIDDCQAKLLITADGGFRGDKIIPLKEIADQAVKNSPSIEKILVAKRTHQKVELKRGRDFWLDNALKNADIECEPAVVDAEDPLFILYTSGSTGKPKGMLHTTAGYMVYTAYTFKNVFDYKNDEIYWCTADVGWITGHSYLIYGPLLNGATTVLFEGIPSYPDFSRFWKVIEKHKVNQFYTAPTAIRSLAKESISYVESADLSSLKVIGSVGEPINEEAWQWYHQHIGKYNCPLVDTWWQTETGGIMISPLANVTPTRPTFASLPLPGIQPALLDEKGKIIKENKKNGNLCISYPFPSIARTIWGDHQRYIDTYFKVFPNFYFTGDGSFRDEVGYYRITGRVDDVIIVSGHNLGTAPIEDAIDEHPKVAESAIVGFPHDIKGNALYGFVILKDKEVPSEDLKKEINQQITEHVGAISKLDKIQFVTALPKTRSGKIMRRILRKIAEGNLNDFGDTSTLLNPECVDELIKGRV